MEEEQDDDFVVKKRKSHHNRDKRSRKKFKKEHKVQSDLAQPPAIAPAATSHHVSAVYVLFILFPGLRHQRL